MKNIAIITGASSGIGEEYFRTISAKESFDEIWVVARNKEKLESLQALTETKLRIFALDLSEKESTDVIARALEEEKPSIKYLVCASGFGRFLAVEEDDPATLQNMVDLNCRSIVGITTACSHDLGDDKQRRHRKQRRENNLDEFHTSLPFSC